MMLSWDNFASFVLTPFKANFFYCVECDILVKYVNKINKVIVIGTTTHRF